MGFQKQEELLSGQPKRSIWTLDSVIEEEREEPVLSVRDRLAFLYSSHPSATTPPSAGRERKGRERTPFNLVPAKPQSRREAQGPLISPSLRTRPRSSVHTRREWGWWCEKRKNPRCNAAHTPRFASRTSSSSDPEFRVGLAAPPAGARNGEKKVRTWFIPKRRSKPENPVPPRTWLTLTRLRQTVHSIAD